MTIHDTKAATNIDLGGQFYLSEEHIGQNRAEATLPLLQALNPTVAVTASSSQLVTQPELIEGHNVVVLCDSLLQDSIQINEICRAKGIKLLVADVSVPSQNGFSRRGVHMRCGRCGDPSLGRSRTLGKASRPMTRTGNQ